MALTTTQVNQAFLATLGRPAEGSAATWGSTSLSLDALLDSIFIAENTDGDFVEYLYQNILGRASDAEGKAFWNSLLATTSKEAVLAQFKAAIIAAGQADPANADYQSFIAQNKAFVTDLYTNLLGRTDAASADAEGVEFWANALASGTSKGALLAQFTAAALANPNSDDAQTLNAKVTVANAITAKFNNFNADVTADQKKAALDALKATMTEVVAGSTAEDFQERIDTFAGNYQNRVAQAFTTKDDDQLDSSEATASTVFSGNVNLIDPAKGTIQKTDSVAGNSNYTDTLRVSVTSDSANKDFSLDSNLPSVSSIEKLIITAGAANVSGTLDGTNYAESATITSTGDVDLKIRGVQKELKVTAGDKKDAAITVESDSLNNYTGSAAKDTINVKAGSVKTIDTGAGKDVVTIASGAKIENEGSIKLGAGDDELTIVSTLLAKTDTLNKISLDGGEGSKDKLTISTDITAVNSITGFETIDAKTDAKISADAANSLTSGTKLSNGSNLKIDMVDKNSLNLKNLKVGNTTDNKPGKADVDVLNVAKGEITLTSTTKNAIVETITLAKTTTDGKTGTVTIKGIGAAELEGESKKTGTNGDKLKITDTIISNSTPKKLEASSDTPQALTANNLHYVNTKISSADDLASKGTVLDLNLSLAAGKALVALNNSAQNKSYIYEITGNTAGLTRDNITLKAIVDNAINKYDQVSGDTIEFVAGVEKDVKPAGGDTANVLTFDNTSGTITLAANGTYKNAKIDNTKTAISINGVDAAITLDGTKGSIAKVNIFATKADAVVTDAASIGNSNYNLYIGGSTTKADASVTTPGSIDGNAITLTSTQLTNAIAQNVIINTTGKVSFADAAALNSHKLDLSKVGANVEITTAVKATGSKVAVSDFFKASSVSGDDSIKFIVDIASNNTVEATAGKDTISWNAGTIAAHKLDLTNDNAVDTVDLTGLKQGNSVDVSKLVTLENIGTTTSAKDLLKVSATTVTVEKTDVSSKGSSLKDTLKKGIADSTANKAYLIIVNDTGATTDNGTYLVYNSNADQSISENDIVVKLSGVYTNIVAGTDGFVTLA